MEHQITRKELLRLEQKIDLLNYKLDKLMTANGIVITAPIEITNKAESKKVKLRARQQAKIIAQEQNKRMIEKILNDHLLKRTVGAELQAQFNLLTTPSADRIREYQRTHNPKAFDGLKRTNHK